MFSGANLQIVDGANATSTVNGTGNLIVGYDETPGTQTGSHNLVLGESQSYTKYGDLLGGVDNEATAAYASAFGEHNSARGLYSLIGGDGNLVSGSASSVLGGYENVVSSASSSIAGAARTWSGPAP